jgi:lambda repressor-like predicted transcriptional regulator
VSGINQTACQVKVVRCDLGEAPCNHCQQPAKRYSRASRIAIDVDMEQPILLQVIVSIHYCHMCEHYFRLQPSFLRPDSIYTNRVVSKAVASVYEDGMAIRRTQQRMRRDFWVAPSEGIIRRWCRVYAASFNFAEDYQPWVVEEFSGILCVDEVYQGELALLVAADPQAPSGDRLVGYQLVHGKINGPMVEQFLTRLRAVGIDPAEVITDGSALYPSALKAVWPLAAHQLCLFHETRKVTQAVQKALRAIRQTLPTPPPIRSRSNSGQLSDHPPSDKADDPATQYWLARRARRALSVAKVHALAEQGLSIRAIARQTGHDRATVQRYLKEPPPPVDEAALAQALPDLPPRPTVSAQRAHYLKTLPIIQSLVEQGWSMSAIAREVGLHRVTVGRWVQEAALAAPVLDAELSTTPPPIQSAPPPPAPWESWTQVRQVHETLHQHRFLFSRRPEHLNDEERAQVLALLNSPIGPQLQAVRAFVTDWYALWHDETGQRRTWDEAQRRFNDWRTQAAYLALPPLHRFFYRMTDSHFEKLSQFLRNPDWEATNDGAERAGRAFRHLQAPHFNFRQISTIEAALVITACQNQVRFIAPTPRLPNACTRGRKPRPLPSSSPVTAAA